MWPWLLGLLSKLPGLLTGINIGAMVTPVVDSVKKYWMFYLPVLLIALNCGTLYEWNHTSALLKTEKAAHSTDIANFKKAQADANTAAQAEKTRLDKESKASATKADAQYSTLLGQYRINLLRYQANQSGTKPTVNYQLPTPSSGYGPGAGTIISDVPGGVLSISLDDANICAINTARLSAVHDWAISLPKDVK